MALSNITPSETNGKDRTNIFNINQSNTYKIYLFYNWLQMAVNIQPIG